MDTLACPRCGSIEIKRIKHSSIVSAKYVTLEEKYDCLDCSYSGPCPLVDKLDLADFKEHLKTFNQKSEE